MEKTKIAIASVLKPVQDTRAYYKFGLSLRETNKYSINIIGFSDKIVKNQTDLSFYPILDNYKSTPLRIWAQFKFLKLLFIIRPKVLIVTTPELLLLSSTFKFILNYQLLVDIQENTSSNLIHNHPNPSISKRFLALLIRIIERSSNLVVDGYIFAETCYVKEFPWIKNPLIIENKHFNKSNGIQKKTLNKQQPLTFLISGTLTPVFGTIEGILWFKKLVEIYPHFQLLVIGHVTMPSYLNRIHLAIDKHPQIKTHLYGSPVDYELILKAYKDTDIHLLPYYSIENICSKMPSKLYDSLALGIPVFISKNPLWKKVIDQNSAGCQVDFEDIQMAETEFLKMIQHEFFPNGGDANATFTQDKTRFLNWFQHIVQGTNTPD
jgi:glycosyltransferase involved in cell wall biosynthesis